LYVAIKGETYVTADLQYVTTAFRKVLKIRYFV